MCEASVRIYGDKNGTIGAMNVCEAPTKTPEMQLAVGRLAAKGKSLYELACMLRSRVEPVMHGAAPKETATGKSGFGAPLAAELDGIGDQLTQIEDVLRESLSRLEL